MHDGTLVQGGTFGVSVYHALCRNELQSRSDIVAAAGFFCLNILPAVDEQIGYTTTNGTYVRTRK